MGDPRDTNRVRRAMDATPRAGFLLPEDRQWAGVDMPLSIGSGQTNSQPWTVREMLRLLGVRPGHKVLDVGSGSGWTTAILAELVGPTGSVLGLERIPQVMEFGRANLERSERPWTAIRLASRGVLGAPDEAPFDRILVSAEADRFPDALADQLADGGVLVVPVAGTMTRAHRRGGELDISTHGQFRFVPLIVDQDDKEQMAQEES